VLINPLQLTPVYRPALDMMAARVFANRRPARGTTHGCSKDYQVCDLQQISSDNSALVVVA
jgi:hypothetical protein